jgi:hypothetical protein
MSDLLLDGERSHETMLDRPVNVKPRDRVTVTLNVDLVITEIAEAHEIVGVRWMPIVRKDDA